MEPRLKPGRLGLSWRTLTAITILCALFAGLVTPPASAAQRRSRAMEALPFHNLPSGLVRMLPVPYGGAFRTGFVALPIALQQSTVDGLPDTDGDGLPDAWEIAHGLNPNDPNDAGLDPDGDGLSNLEEYFFHTDPQNADTDGDGMPDGW